MNLHPDLIELLMEFEKFDVKYLIVGGWAVSIHSEPRFTKDLDLWLDVESLNLKRASDALKAYRAPKALVDDVATLKSNEFVFFGIPPARVDFLGSVDGVRFSTAWQARKTMKWNRAKVYVLSIEDLIKSKKAAGRPRDIADHAQLLNHLKNRKGKK